MAGDEIDRIMTVLFQQNATMAAQGQKLDNVVTVTTGLRSDVDTLKSKSDSNGGAWRLGAFVVMVFGAIFASHWLWPSTITNNQPTTTNNAPQTQTPQIQTIQCGKYVFLGTACPPGLQVPTTVAPAQPSTPSGGARIVIAMVPKKPAIEVVTRRETLVPPEVKPISTAPPRTIKPVLDTSIVTKTLAVVQPTVAQVQKFVVQTTATVKEIVITVTTSPVLGVPPKV